MKSNMIHLNGHLKPFQGKRLYLTKIREEEKSELLVKIRGRQLTPEEDAAKGTMVLVIFEIDKVLPLIGAK